MLEVSPKPRVRETIETGLYLNTVTGAYEVGYTDPETKRWVLKTLFNDPGRTQRCRNVSEARRARKRLMSHVEEGLVVAPNATTLAEVVVRWFASFKAQVTAGERRQITLDGYDARWRNWIEPALGKHRVDQILARDIERFYDDLRMQGLSLSTRKDIHQILGSMLSEAVSEGVIGVSPMNRVRDAKIPKGKTRRRFRILSHEEIQRFVAAAPDEYQLILLLLAYTGTRVGEAVELRWMDVDLVEGVIRPRRASRNGVISHATKTDAGMSEERKIPILPFLREELLLHLEAETMAGRGLAADLVCSDQGEPFSKNPILAVVKTAAKQIGVTETFTTHTLRHTFLSQCARSGIDVVHVSKIAGHSSPAITLDVYSHFFNEGEATLAAQAKLAAIGFGQIERNV